MATDLIWQAKYCTECGLFTLKWLRADIQELLTEITTLRAQLEAAKKQRRQLDNLYYNRTNRAENRAKRARWGFVMLWNRFKDSRDERNAARAEIERLKTSQIPDGWICHP